MQLLRWTTSSLVLILLVKLHYVVSLQFMGRALSFDWHFRSHICVRFTHHDKRKGKSQLLILTLPPFKETLDLKPKPERYSRKRHGISLSFVAFGKAWTANLEQNNMLVAPQTHLTEQTIDGQVVREYTTINSDCYYVGTAHGGLSEYGMISLSTCGEQINGLIVTNINDYVIYENGWKRQRYVRSLSHRLKQLRIKVADTSQLGSIEEQLKLKLSQPELLLRNKRMAAEAETPKFHKLDPPSGRNLYVEFGVIVDMHYMKDFSKSVSSSRTDLLHHILLSYNNAQLWYLHPTLGFHVWIILKDVILIDDDMPIDLDEVTHSNPAALCKWVKRTFKNEELWDEVMILSSKPDIWGGRVGLAQRSGVCEDTGMDRCAGVSHVNFQLASFARLIAHEAMHPMGVSDDYEGRTSTLCYSGIMRRGVWQDHDWSACAVQAFERWAGTTPNQCVSRNGTKSLRTGFSPPQVSVNIAWRANSIQSSTYRSEKEWGSWKATDGPVTGLPETKEAVYGSCTHTLKEDQPWIRVDLDKQYRDTTLEAVVVYNRDDCCADRLKNFEIRIGNNVNFKRNPLCAHYKGIVGGGRNGAAVLRCSRPLTGRYVSLQRLDNDSILTVCEIQVMAKIPSTDFSVFDYGCRDHNSYCLYWGRVGECSRVGQERWMRDNCPLTCGACRREEPDIRRNAQRSSHFLSATIGPAEDCVDSHESCMHYAANGDCDIDRDTKRRCARSCGLCTASQTTALLYSTTTERLTTIPTTTTLPTTTLTSTTTERLTTRPTTTTLPTTTVTSTTTTTNTTTVTTPTTKTTITAFANYPRPVVESIQHRDSKDTDRQRLQPPVPNSSQRRTQTSHLRDTVSVTRTRLGNGVKLVGRRLAVRDNLDDSLWNQDEPLTKIKPETFNHSRSTIQIGSERRECLDVNENCDKWVSQGYCSISVLIGNLCPKSCSLCTTVYGEVVDVCEDSSPNCSVDISLKTCNDDSVYQSCRMSCGRCEKMRSVESTNQANMIQPTNTVASITSTTVATTTSATDTTPAVSKPTKCVQTRPECSSWAEIGHCKVESVQRLCPIACGKCTPTKNENVSPMTCVDNHRACESWAGQGYCRKASVLGLCAKSCKNCDG